MISLYHVFCTKVFTFLACNGFCLRAKVWLIKNSSLAFLSKKSLCCVLCCYNSSGQRPGPGDEAADALAAPAHATLPIRLHTALLALKVVT